MSRNLCTLLCFFFAHATLVAQTNGSDNDSFLSGLRAYEKGEYESAQTEFSKTLETNETAAAHHNLGLTYYQLDQAAKATWHLERALLLSPYNQDYLQRLNIVREQLGLLPFSLKWYNKVSGLLTLRTWAISALTSFWLLLAAFVLPGFINSKKRIPISSIRLFCLLIFVVSASSVWLNAQLLDYGTVISNESASLHAAPAKGAPDNGFARPGERARILDQHNGFYQVETEGSATGWISQKAFEPIYNSTVSPQTIE